MEKKVYSVLVVEDSEDDRFFIRQVIKRFPRFQIVGEVSDGEEAVEYFSGKKDFADRRKNPLPDLVLLDLKMPRKSGFEVLQWLRTNPIPDLTVVVLSSSPLAQDIGASLALGAHGFWTKTSNSEKQNRIVEEIEAMLDKRRQDPLAHPRP